MEYAADDAYESPPAASVPPSVIGPELEIDKPILATPGMAATDPAIAFDGTNYLVVWSDARTNGGSDIWAERVDQNGAVLDPTGIIVAVADGVQGHPAVAFDGSRFAVAWEDFKVDKGTEADIGAAFVGTDGTVTALPAIATTTDSEISPAIAHGAGGTVVTWIQNKQVMATLLSANGAGAPFAITTGALADRNPKIAADDAGNFLVTYAEADAASHIDIYGQRLASTAGALTATGAPIAIDMAEPLTQKWASVTWAAGNYLVAFARYTVGGDLYATRITPAGAVVDTHVESNKPVAGRLVVSAAGSQDPDDKVRRTDAECVVLWQDGRSLAALSYDVLRAAHLRRRSTCSAPRRSSPPHRGRRAACRSRHPSKAYFAVLARCARRQQRT